MAFWLAVCKTLGTTYINFNGAPPYAIDAPASMENKLPDAGVLLVYYMPLAERFAARARFTASVTRGEDRRASPDPLRAELRAIARALLCLLTKTSCY